MTTAPPTVLLVEDDEVTRDVFTRFFVHHGFLALTAATAHDAIGQLKQPLTPIDAVILDIGLPDVSGAEFCGRLRELHPTLPVIVCSGALGMLQTEELQQLGIEHFFLKPVQMSELLTVLRIAIRRQES